MQEIYDTIIIGSGPAGLTAAIYNIRANLKTIVISGNTPGGQLTITTTVDNWPGFTNGTGGVKLMMDMQQQVKNLGGEIKQGLVKNISDETIASEGNSNRKIFIITLEDGEILKSKAVIITTGAKAKWLGIPKERELIGHGISGCATCDGMFFRDKTVAVIGGGDVACEDADFLTKFASKVYIIHRRDELRAQVPQKKRVTENKKIEFLWNNEVSEIHGEEKLESIKIKNNKTGEERELIIDGMFVAIGHTPETEFVKGMVETKETGQILTGKNPEFLTMTSKEGIFAAGDCVDDVYRQAIVAAGDGAKAGLDAERWLKN